MPSRPRLSLSFAPVPVSPIFVSNTLGLLKGVNSEPTLWKVLPFSQYAKLRFSFLVFVSPYLVPRYAPTYLFRFVEHGLVLVGEDMSVV